MEDAKSSKTRNWYISGIYYPKPKAESEIPTDQKRWTHLNKEQLSDVNSQLIGKPLLIDHPFDADGLPLLHEEFGANYRGKVVNSQILSDGRGYFIAQVPVNKNFKTHLFKKDLSKGRYTEFSICHSKDDSGREIPDHIAILEKGKARFPGCDMLEILKLPKKRHLQNSEIERIKNYLDGFRKSREKISRARPLICCNSGRMESAPPGQVQDDAMPPSAGGSNRKEILRELLKDPRYHNNPDELLGAFDNLLSENERATTELERIKKENETLLFEKRAKEEQTMKTNIDECLGTFKEMASFPADESVEVTPEAKSMKQKFIDDVFQEVYGNAPLAEADRMATFMSRVGREIAVCSRDGIKIQLERQRQLNEAIAARKPSHSPLSSFQERYVPQKPAPASSVQDLIKPDRLKPAAEPEPGQDFLRSLQEGIQKPDILGAATTRSDLMRRYKDMEAQMQSQRSAKRQRW